MLFADTHIHTRTHFLFGNYHYYCNDIEIGLFNIYCCMDGMNVATHAHYLLMLILHSESCLIIYSENLFESKTIFFSFLLLSSFLLFLIFFLCFNPTFGITQLLCHNHGRDAVKCIGY